VWGEAIGAGGLLGGSAMLGEGASLDAILISFIFFLFSF
jgi:hypothetical protein